MYRWDIPKKYANKNIGEYQYDKVNYLSFTNGESFKQNKFVRPVIKYDVNDNFLEKYDCIPNSSRIPVVNKKMKEFLEYYASNEVEFYNVDIYAGNELFHDFYLLNIITKTSLVDLTNSVYIYIPGTQEIMSFNRVCFIDDKLTNFNITRCSEYLPYIMLSNELVDRMKKEKFKGVGYTKVMTTSEL
ncbi:hypothetical protein EL09_15305 [Salmonella enterica subsp. enterica]|nr:hypothetical protein [Salmonella enterica subsp. enterica]